MKKIKNLNTYQKSILLILAAMVLVFTAMYPFVLSREGFAYQDSIFLPHKEHGMDIYSGRLNGENAVFTVTSDKQVTFQYGDKIYGPYTVREDSSAIPKQTDSFDFDPGIFTGIEIRREDQVIFRGGVSDFGEQLWFYNESGSIPYEAFMSVRSPGAILTDEHGNIIDPVEPSIYTIVSLIKGPEMIHKGNIMGWFSGIFVCALTVISILFADELFRWNLSFQIRNVERAEPSDWEMGSRYLTWTILPVFALILFIVGLK